MENSKISHVIVMLTTNDSSKTPQQRKRYIMRGFLMEKSEISLVIVMLTIKVSSNFNKGNVHYEGILNGKKQD